MTTPIRERAYRDYGGVRPASVAAPPTLALLAPRAPYLRRLVARHFPPNRDAVILDLGCGYGAIEHFAEQAGYSHITGIDGAPDQVEAARHLGISSVHLGDAILALKEAAPESLDCVIAFDFIEHFSRNELVPIVDAALAALKPGGRWIIHTVNGESPFFGGIRYGDITHEEAFTRTSLGQLLRSSGFSEVRCYEDAPISHGLKSAMRSMVWSLVRSAFRIALTAENGSDKGAIFSQNFLSVAVK